MRILLSVDQNEIKSWLFFSDHGEEVFNEIDFKGHRPHDITKNMVEIPVILWTNNPFQTTQPEVVKFFRQHINHPWIASDIFHMIGCISGMKSAILQPNLGLCAANPTTLPTHRLWRKL